MELQKYQLPAFDSLANDYLTALQTKKAVLVKCLELPLLCSEGTYSVISNAFYKKIVYVFQKNLAERSD